MKIRYYGFKLKPGSGFSLQDFFTYLATIQGTQIEHDFSSRKRLFLLDDSHATYYRGLLITIKDHNVKGGVKTGQWGGAKVYHFAHGNKRAGGMPPALLLLR